MRTRYGGWRWGVVIVSRRGCCVGILDVIFASDWREPVRGMEWGVVERVVDHSVVVDGV